MSQRFEFPGSPLSLPGRAGLLAASFVLVAGFTMACWLDPDPRGYGTHQQVGLPECTVQLLWNRPCPGCGMTTCFAHLVRGQWSAAARANPAGLFLGAVCFGLVPWLWLSAWQGKTVGVDAPVEALLALMVSVVVVALTVWIIRLCW